MRIRNILPKKTPKALAKSLIWLTSAFLLTGFTAESGLAQKIDIKTSSSTSPIYQITSQLNGSGVVINQDEQPIRLQVDADFRYNERVIARTSQLKSIRQYFDAKANLKIGTRSYVNQLSDEHRVFIAQARAVDQPIRMASLGGPITQNESELIDTPANTLILSEVFARNGVRKGDSWKPNREVLTNFLNVDSIEDTDIQIQLEQVKHHDLVLVIGGQATGTIDGSETDFAINGNVRFDNRLGIVVQSDLTITQQRDMGLLAPGLDATFKMATSIRPVSTSKRLSDAGLAKLRKSAGKISDELLLAPNATPISVLHPKQWKVIADHGERTVLRYNRRGRMIGQCDILPLPNRLQNQPQTLDQFKAVVKTKLADSSGEILDAQQSITSSGLEWMRVDAKGASEGVNLRWTYYTITSGDGRRVQLVFTTEPEHADVFAGLDRLLVDTLQFKDISTASKTTNASFNPKTVLSTKPSSSRGTSKKFGK